MDSTLSSPPFSPSQDISFSSPEELDPLRTPFNDHADGHSFQKNAPFDYVVISPCGHTHDFSLPNTRNPLENRPVGDRSPLFGPSLSPKVPQYQSFSTSFPPCPSDLTSRALEINPFDNSFQAATRCNESMSSQASSYAPVALCHYPSTPDIHRGGTNASTIPGEALQLSQHCAIQEDLCIRTRNASAFSPRFPAGHYLDKRFVQGYHLGDELGSGGYGFVMTALRLADGCEVAVKFIIKSKVPESAWMEAAEFTRPLPAEVIILNLINHENIVKCLDLFEDSLYFYLVQELHGSPWHKRHRLPKVATDPGLSVSATSLPSLSGSSSIESITESEIDTPPQSSTQLNSFLGTLGPQIYNETGSQIYSAARQDYSLLQKNQHQERPALLSASHPTRPEFSRRPSHDLFECIEQSKYKCLSEDQARYVFAQVVEAVYYLDSLGITHRDIKDENLVIDKDFKVKLIDFGSAIINNVNETQPYHHLFFGTSAYAASEILRKKPYQAPPAEIWTLGILLSYLLTGTSPFPTEKDAIDGKIVLAENARIRLSRLSLHLMRRCLERDPAIRANIQEVRAHRWLEGALDGA